MLLITLTEPLKEIRGSIKWSDAVEKIHALSHLTPVQNNNNSKIFKMQTTISQLWPQRIIHYYFSKKVHSYTMKKNPHSFG